MTKGGDKNIFTWGLILWVIGYVLGFVFFPFVPAEQLGWYITPFGILAAIWIIAKKLKAKTLHDYVKTSIVWTVLAIALDYIFIVILLNPEDGYYKPDVYLYYCLTFILPIAYFYYKNKKASK